MLLSAVSPKTQVPGPRGSWFEAERWISESNLGLLRPGTWDLDPES
jgi:hypothetical protein